MPCFKQEMGLDGVVLSIAMPLVGRLRYVFYTRTNLATRHTKYTHSNTLPARIGAELFPATAHVEMRRAIVFVLPAGFICERKRNLHWFKERKGWRNTTLARCKPLSAEIIFKIKGTAGISREVKSVDDDDADNENSATAAHTEMKQNVDI